MHWCIDNPCVPEPLIIARYYGIFIHINLTFKTVCQCDKLGKGFNLYIVFMNVLLIHALLSPLIIAG